MPRMFVNVLHFGGDPRHCPIDKEGERCCISYLALVSDVSCLIYFEPTWVTLDFIFLRSRCKILTSDNKSPIGANI